MNGRPAPVLEEFAIADTDRAAVEDIVARVEGALEGSDTSRRSIILAALAELSARYMQTAASANGTGKRKAARHE
jgi:hypothetical protein